VKNGLIVCFLLESGAIAAAQDLSLPPRMEFDSPAMLRKTAPGEMEWSLEIMARWHLMDRDTGGPGDVRRWHDVFSYGFGARIELSHVVPIGSSWSFGGYAAPGVAFFQGKTVTDPTSGIKTRFDDWRVVPFTVGPKVNVALGPGIFAEAYGGLGGVWYSGVDSSSAGVKAPFVESSLAFAWEFGARIGAMLTYRDTLQGLVLGVGFEGWGRAEVDRMRFPGFSPRSLGNVTIDFGLCATF
jgi:hypothetical protein